MRDGGLQLRGLKARPRPLRGLRYGSPSVRPGMKFPYGDA